MARFGSCQFVLACRRTGPDRAVRHRVQIRCRLAPSAVGRGPEDRSSHAPALTQVDSNLGVPVRIQYAAALDRMVSLDVVSCSYGVSPSLRSRTRLIAVLGPPSVSLAPRVAGRSSRIFCFAAPKMRHTMTPETKAATPQKVAPLPSVYPQTTPQVADRARLSLTHHASHHGGHSIAYESTHLLRMLADCTCNSRIA